MMWPSPPAPLPEERGEGNRSLLSLSCFTTAEKAEAFYMNLRKAFRNIATSIGDSLSEGCLANEEGRKTSTASNGHFDFYEFESCNLNKTFKTTKKLMEETNNESN